MDNQSREKLDEILRKEYNALTPGDKDFLRARESYLTVEQKSAYAGVFSGFEPDEDPVEPAESPKKKAK